MVGMDLVSSFRPDAVILDLMLPSLTGVEFVKKIRANPQTENLPVIVFSNTYLTNMVQEAWKAGATKCLSKANCTPKQVIQVVRSTISGNGTSPLPGHVAKAAAESSVAGPGAAQAAHDADAAFQADLR